MATTNKHIIKSFVETTNAQDWEKAKALLHENVQRHSSTHGMKPVSSHEQLIDFHKQEVLAFPDLKETVLFMVEEEDMVATRIHFQGTQLGSLGEFKPSGKVLDACFNCFFKIIDEKIMEIWVEFDQLNGLVQLGHYPPSHDSI